MFESYRSFYDGHSIDTFNEVHEDLKQRYPKYELLIKEESRLMRIIGKIMFFSDFENFITIIGYKVYVPEKNMNPALWRTLIHESVHMDQFRRNPFFPILYLFPQILSILSILAILAFWFSPYWALNLLWLLCLLPFPAPFRAKYEAEAYAVNIELETSEYSDPTNYYVRHFVGSNYYFMMPIRSVVVRMLSRYRQKANQVVSRYNSLL